MSDQRLPDGHDPRDRAILRLTQKRDRPLRYLLTIGFLVTLWAFFGGGTFALAVIVFLWGIAITIDAWAVYWRKPPSEDQIRTEMERMK